MTSSFKRFTKATILTAFAVGMVSCGPPQELEDAAALYEEFSTEATAKNTDFFRTLRPRLEKDEVVNLSPYYEFRDQVVSSKTRFLSGLSKCRKQAEADALYQELPQLAPQNDEHRERKLKLIDENKTGVEISNFKKKVKPIERKRSDAEELLQVVNDEHGSDGFEDIRNNIAENQKSGNDKLRSISTNCEGFLKKVEAKKGEVQSIHDEVTKLLAECKSVYENWQEPPPAPEAPKRVLFTVETTPAMYEKLLVPLTQGYKGYSLVYVGEQTGNHCVADARNEEGVVFRIVDPANMQPAMDNLEQNKADIVIAFRDAFPAESYAKCETLAAEDDADLNSIIISGIAYNALVFKTNTANAINDLTTSGLAKELAGSSVYVGTDGTLDRELFNTLLKDSQLPVEAIDNLATQGTASPTGVAAMAFRREETPGKNLRVARTPTDENVYFHPTVGNISGGRYAYAAAANAVLNPASCGNGAAREFLSFVLSTEGQNIVKSAGFISRDEYDSDNVELQRIKALFLAKGYTIGRIITHDTFLFPKNDTRISKDPKVTNRKSEFQEFDSNIRSNFGHITKVLQNTTSSNGIIAVGIIGHASSEGGERVNMPLSKNRAKYTGACIQERTKVSLLLTDGMGSTVPVDTNNEESGRVRNRRATAYVLEVFEIGKNEK